MNMEPENSQAVKLREGRVEPHVEGRHLLFHWFLSLQHHTAALDCWGELGGEKRGKRRVYLSFSLVLNQHRFQLKLGIFLFVKDPNFLCYLVFSGIVPEVGKQCG